MPKTKKFETTVTVPVPKNIQIVIDHGSGLVKFTCVSDWSMDDAVEKLTAFISQIDQENR